MRTTVLMTTAFPFNLFSQCLLHCPCTSVAWQGNLVRHGRLKVPYFLECFHPQVSSFNNSIGHQFVCCTLPYFIFGPPGHLVVWLAFKEARYAKTFVLFSPGNTQICAIYIQPSAGRSTCIELLHAYQGKFGK